MQTCHPTQPPMAACTKPTSRVYVCCRIRCRTHSISTCTSPNKTTNTSVQHKQTWQVCKDVHLVYMTGSPRTYRVKTYNSSSRPTTAVLHAAAGLFSASCCSLLYF
jgi:hypothetical protein